MLFSDNFYSPFDTPHASQHSINNNKIEMTNLFPCLLHGRRHFSPVNQRANHRKICVNTANQRNG